MLRYNFLLHHKSTSVLTIYMASVECLMSSRSNWPQYIHPPVNLILSDCTDSDECCWRPMAKLCLITWAALTAEEDWSCVLHVSTHMDSCAENRISSHREWVSMCDVFHVVMRHTLDHRWKPSFCHMSRSVLSLQWHTHTHTLGAVFPNQITYSTQLVPFVSVVCV